MTSLQRNTASAIWKRFALIGLYLLIFWANASAQQNKDGGKQQELEVEEEVEYEEARFDIDAYNDSLEREYEQMRLAEEADSLVVTRIVDPQLIAEIRTLYAKPFGQGPSANLPKTAAEIKAALIQNTEFSNLRATIAIFDADSSLLTTLDQATIQILYDHSKIIFDNYEAYKNVQVFWAWPEALKRAAPVRYATLVIEWLNKGGMTLDMRLSMISALGDLPANPASIAFLAQTMKATPSPILDSDPRLAAFGALCKLYGKTKSPDRETILDALVPYLDRPETTPHLRYAAATIFSQNPTPATEAFVKEYDFASLWSFTTLEDSVRLAGTAAQPMVLEMLKDPYQASQAIPLLPLAWPGKPDFWFDVIMDIVKNEQGDDWPNGYVDHRAHLQECWSIGGHAMALRYLETVEDADELFELEEYLRIHYLPIDERHPLRVYANAFLKAGLVDRPLTTLQLDSIRDFENWNDESDFAWLLVQRLPYFVKVDPSNEWNPAPCEYFLETIVPATNGGLKHLECYDHLSVFSGFEPKTTVWLILNAQAYQFEWRGGQSGQSQRDQEVLMNQLLPDAGITDRFYAIETDDTWHYLFTDAAKAEKIREILEGAE